MFYRFLIACMLCILNVCWGSTEHQISMLVKRGVNINVAKDLVYNKNPGKTQERIQKAAARPQNEVQDYWNAKHQGNTLKDHIETPRQQAEYAYNVLMTSYGLDEGVAQISLSYQHLKSVFDDLAPKVVVPEPLDLQSFVGKGVAQVIGIQDDICVLKCIQALPGKATFPRLDALFFLEINQVHLNASPLGRGVLSPDDHLIFTRFASAKDPANSLLDVELHIHP